MKSLKMYSFSVTLPIHVSKHAAGLVLLVVCERKSVSIQRMTWWIIKIILSFKSNPIGSVMMESPGQKSHDNFYVENNWCWLCLLPHDTMLSNVLQLWRPSGYSQTLIICQIMLSDLQRPPQCSCKEINDSSILFGRKKERKHSLAVSSLRVYNGLNVDYVLIKF